MSPHPRPVAMITGASRGIGFAIAETLAQQGFDLYVTGLEVDGDGAAERLRTHGTSVTYLAGDIADISVSSAWIDRIRTESGRIDCLVNNAGMGAVARTDVLDISPDNFDRVMSVNVRGTVFLTIAALKLMVGRGVQKVPRSVVNITSVSATHVSVDRLDYCVSKAALAMWSKGLAVRLAKEGIGVFDVRPGIIRSEMTAKVSDKYDRLIADGLVPTGRWGEGKDVADVVSGLARGDFAFATGTIIDVGGGLSIPRF